jgi:hypothetical protein
MTMRPKTNKAIAHVVSLVGLGAVIGWSSPGDAYVQQIVVDQTATVDFKPIKMGTSTPGDATSYTIYVGRVFGELKPNDPDNNAIITDIELAPKNKGRVDYVANFEIITPADPTKRNGLMVHSVPNRGGNSINTGAMLEGVTYVQSGWQGDLLTQCSPSPAISYPCFDLNSGPYGSLNATTGAFTPPQVPDVAGTGGLTRLANYVVQVPVAHNRNGSAITGKVYSHVCTGTNGCGLAVGSAPTSTAQLVIQGAGRFSPYQPASMDTSLAEFWSVSSQTFTGVTGPKTPIASDQWAWAYCPNGWPGTPNPNWICLKNATFDPNLLYEMVYTAKNPLVLGVGFAAFRDLGSFLRFDPVAPGGGSNPIFGTVSKTYTVGSSQSGAFLHGLIFYGFNRDEHGRKVFDGAWPQIDGRMMVMNLRWGQPNNLMYLYVAGDEAPVWWPDYPNLARGLPTNGLLHRCSQTGTCPEIVETFASAELYSEKFSASLCGFTCVEDIPLPKNVHRYYTPGGTHGGGAANFNWTSPAAIVTPAGQSLPNNPTPATHTNNALTYAFIQLLMQGTPMPDSVYPTLARGELVPNTAAAEGFPDFQSTVPPLTYHGDQAWPPFVYDFGPQEDYDQESGIPTIQPPIIERVLPVYGAKVNADGNEVVTGMPTVLGEAPLGTYVGWNLATTGWYGPNASNGPGSVGQVFAGAGNSGGYWPFWDTKANRVAHNDPRLSLEERYGSHVGYVCVVTAAAKRAFEQGFLLASDRDALVANAASGNVLAAPFTPTADDTAHAASLCSQ